MIKSLKTFECYSREPYAAFESFVMKVVVSQCLLIDYDDSSQPDEPHLWEAGSAEWLQCLYRIVVHSHLEHFFKWQITYSVNPIEFI